MQRLRLVDLNELGYRSLGTAQERMKQSCLHDGSARWVPVPFEVGASLHCASQNVGVYVLIEITSISPLADLSWMAAKAYSYALYTGCVDLLKRRSTRIGGSRYLGVGATEFCDAQIGAVKMTVTVTVIDAGNPFDREEAR